MATESFPLGIDVGGSGIKGAPVDLSRGEFHAERLRIDTPQQATPQAVAAVIAQIVEHFDDVRSDSPIGVTIPGVVQQGVVKTAANIDKSWINCEIEKLLEDELQHDVVVMNDADAAGVAEIRHGAAKGRKGLVILATLGTGIGTAVINNGILVPNSELGHIEVNGYDGETRAAASIKKMENLLWPDLIVVGGGVSKKPEKFLPLLDIRTPIIPATLANTAGIIGAAQLAADTQAVSGKHR